MAEINETVESASESVVEEVESIDLVADPAIESKGELSAPEEKKAEKKRIKQLKLKIDGEDSIEELPFEFDDDAKTIDYLTKQLQMAKMGQKRAQSYASLEKEVKEFVDALRKDPRKVLSDPSIGVDIKQLAAQIIEDEIESSKKTPEQLEHEKLQKELQALKSEREKEKETFNQKELERLKEKAYQDYDNQMSAALEKGDLPKTPYVIKKMADYMLLALNEGVDATPEDVLPLVREEMHNDLKEMFAVMPDDVIEALVGKDVITRIRKKKVAAAKAAPVAPLNVKDVGGKPSDSNKDDGQAKTSFKDFFGI